MSKFFDDFVKEKPRNHRLVFYIEHPLDAKKIRTINQPEAVK
jgi:hypothetical protein